MAKSTAKLALASYDDIFQTDSKPQSGFDSQDDACERVYEIPLTELHTFENHPYHVNDDDCMQETAETISDRRAQVSGIARPRAEGGYELISGRRRKRACGLAGKTTMPVIIREMDDGEAIIAMADCNLQRETILPSQRAWAYRMKLEAMNRRGARTDLTSSHVGNKSKGTLSVNILAEQEKISKSQIFRYIRLTELVPALSDMVDANKISVNPAENLSYLTRTKQAALLDIMEKYDATPSLSQDNVQFYGYNSCPENTQTTMQIQKTQNKNFIICHNLLCRVV